MMSHQVEVTTYFTRKRKREGLTSSKRKKLNDGRNVLCDSEAKSTTKQLKEVNSVKKCIKNNARRLSKTKSIQEYFNVSVNGIQNKVSLPVGDHVNSLSSDFSSPALLKSCDATTDLLSVAQNHQTFDEMDDTVTQNCDSAIVAASNRQFENHKKSSVKLSKVNAPIASSSMLSQTTRTPKLSKPDLSGSSSSNANPVEKIQKDLKGKSKLKDLQETLLKIKELKEKREQTHRQNEVKKAADDTKKRNFAYSKYHSLAQTIPKGLLLPYKYKILKDLFQSLDTIVSMLHNREETISWSKVQRSVEEMTRKKFVLDHLAQIKSVFPDAYLYKQEPNVASFGDSLKKTRCELTLVPILERRKETGGEMDGKMTGSILIHRRHYFHLELLSIVKQHHSSFLNNLQPSLEVNSGEIRRWHPQFPLDTIPDVPASSLPPPPNEEYNQCKSAKEVFEKARGKLTKKAEDAFQKLASLKGNSCGSQIDSNNNSGSDVTPLATATPSVHGISSKLLTKIREKEAKQKVKSMLRSDDDRAELEKLTMLPDVARALRSLFVNEKKSSLPMCYLSLKLSKSCPLVPNPDSMDKLLRLLASLVPSWFEVARVRKYEYGRIVDRQLQINDVLQQLDSHSKAVESR